MSVQWWSIEVRDGVLPAMRWKDGYGEALLEAAVTHGARKWEWTVIPGGVVLELAFRESEEWERFRSLPVVTAALDATPDPVNGLYVYPGRGRQRVVPLPPAQTAPDRLRRRGHPASRRARADRPPGRRRAAGRAAGGRAARPPDPGARRLTA